MEETDLIEPASWQSAEARLAGGEAPGGLMDFLRAEERLQGHVLFATSGSAGSPKWVALSKRALLASAEAVNRRLGCVPEDCWLRAIPARHVGGFAIHARAYCSGARIALFDGRWDCRRFAAACVRERATLASLVPTQVHDLVDGNVAAPACLRAVLVGGGHLSPALRRRAIGLGWPVLPTYGLTEAASQVATASIESLAEETCSPFLPVLDHWEARCDKDDRLVLRGKALFSGYVVPGRQGEWRLIAPFDDGWFVTNDRVELAAGEGEALLLRFLGRRDQMLKILGELVDLDAVNLEVRDLAGRWRASVAVVDVPNPRAGARLVLASENSVPKPEIDQILRRFNDSAPGYSRISSCVRVKELPRSDLGKVLADGLRAIVSEAGRAAR